MEMKQEESIKNYEQSFSDADKIAYEIAKAQLESSFDIVKSIGYLDYLRKNNINILNNNENKKKHK